VASEDEARRMIASIRSGGDFAALARRDSLHVESAAKGGDLGAHAGCRWARATVTMLEALAPGQIHPQPVKGSNGWGVYRLEAKEPVVPRTFARYREELLSGRFEPECPWKPPVDIAPAAPGSAPRSPAAAPGHPAAAPGPGPGQAPTPRRLP
jgi:peptidyl-prolyl cis-trans isomerase C